MTRLTIEDTVYRNLTQPYRTGKPAHACINMMTTTGKEFWVVTATATKNHDDVDPESNKYGNKMIKEKMALQWLRMDTCPLRTGQANPNTNEGPCESGAVCIHLPKIKKDRMAAHQLKETAYAEAWTKEEERKSNQKVNAEMIGDAVSRAVKGSNGGGAEVEAMKEKMEAMESVLADMVESKRKKPSSKKDK